ncbi:Rpn family recombination-promoting nuclease/putative transposase [Burkholderia sp. LMU1-1-1.1]|uniref:Rpn family recombination-promoting nuclease/putative transposase n=1 Tax=Burkholderia sp. LMU1-1-1.1 TaxID=3135266 RepID=UPI003421889F
MASVDDTAYKQLFVHPEMVRDLLLGFVPGTWVRQLDLSSFERVNGSYVGDGGQQRHSDMVWKVRLSGEWIYVYLVLEFQSRSDPWMALRMQVYVGLLYQDLVKRHELPQPFQLPPVFPVVLYNGKQPWSACTSLADLIIPLPEDLQPLQAAQRYVLVDQWRLKNDLFAGFDNYAAIAFRIERLDTAQDISDELEKWRRMTPSTWTSTAQQGITRWAANRLRRRGLQRIIDLTDASKEVEAMSVPIFYSLDDALRYEALLDGHRERLKKVLVKRFGPLSARLSRRITYAEMDDLDRWSDRLFEAKTVREIFADKQSA